MPYISEKERVQLDDCIDSMVNCIIDKNKDFPDTLGRINYCFSRVISKLMGEVRYAKIAMVTGVLENIKQEFYRRLASKYEDKKILSEGDIPEYKRWS